MTTFIIYLAIVLIWLIRERPEREDIVEIEMEEESYPVIHPAEYRIR